MKHSKCRGFSRVSLTCNSFIKESSTVASRAACYLEAERRIALTGTPIQNKLDDVWALFKFLRLTPLDSREIFVDKVLSLCKSGAQVGLARLQLIMRSCTLRRTKDMTGENGKKILELPERKEYQQWLSFRDDERAIYDSIKTAVAAKVDELKKQKQLGKNYATVLQEAMRLRQICDHVDLIKNGAVEEDYDGTVMDYDVAVAGIDANGLSQARGVSIIAYLKDTDAARCVECDQELADRFPSLTLGDDDLKPDAEEKADSDGKTGRRGKKGSCNPILTSCQHLYCELRAYCP
jgi:SWI/SNF-related matrix-associated actin-dependent regulator of chromatin subfamily A3